MRDSLMNTEPGFEAALDANPRDQETRSVYVDWLMDHEDGDDEHTLILALKWQLRHYYYPVLFKKYWRWFFGCGVVPIDPPIREMSLPRYTVTEPHKPIPKRLTTRLLQKHRTRLNADMALGRFIRAAKVNTYVW